MKIQLITFTGCPHAPLARAVLERALTAARITERIEAVDTLSPETPEHLRTWGSPTILVNGEDVGGSATPTGPGCRLYRDAQGRMQGAPREDLLLAALERSRNERA